MTTKVTDFDYDLPKMMIAQSPLYPREMAKLMVLNKTDGGIEHHTVADLISKR